MRILLTTHGAPHDDLALRFGACVARNADEPVVLLSVAEHESDRSKAEATLERGRALLAGGPKVETRVRIGPAAREIIYEAAEGHYDLVIVGERQNPNLLAHFLAGSTSIRVVEHAPCPVIVAKGRAGPVGRILLCDSGAEGPLANLRPASSEARPASPSLLARFTAQLSDLLQGEEDVTVLHVMSQISAGREVGDTQLLAGAEELIASGTPEGEFLVQDVQALGRPGVRARPKVRHGLVVDEILEEAQEGDYDLVVIGAHRGAGWQRILLDDLAHKILVQMDRPVLVVR